MGTSVRAALLIGLILAAVLAPLTVTAQGEQPQVRADPMRVELMPGAQFRGEVTLTNPRATQMAYQLSSATYDAVNVFLDATNGTLAAGAQARVGFVLSVPFDHTTDRAIVDFRAWEDTGPGPSPWNAGIAYLLVHVMPPISSQSFHDGGKLPHTDFASIGAAIEDGNHYKGRVTVTNANDTATKTFPLRIRLPAGWTPTLSATSLTLAPRQSAVVDIRADPSASAVNGTGGLEIGERNAHTLVQISLNVTHTNRTELVNGSARLRLSADVDELAIQAGVETLVNVTIANDGDAAWVGPLSFSAGAGFAVDGPSAASVAPRGTTRLQLLVRADAALEDGALGNLAVFAGNESLTLRLRYVAAPLAPPQLRLLLDRSVASFVAGGSTTLNATIENGGDVAWSGDIIPSAPLGLGVTGGVAQRVPAHGSVTAQLTLFTLATYFGPIDGDATFSVPGSTATVEVHAAARPFQNVTLFLEPPVLFLVPGQNATVKATVENLQGAPWRGDVSFESPVGVTAGASVASLDVPAGAARSFIVTVELGASDASGIVEIVVGDARATLHVNPGSTAAPAQPAPPTTLTEIGDPLPAALVATPADALTPAEASALAAAGIGVAAGGVALANRKWPLAFAGLYARLAPSRLLEHPMRAKMRRLIEDAPGLSRNEVGRRLGLAPGALAHHLDKLLRAGIVVAVPDGHMRRHYVAGSPKPEARAALDARIVAHLRASGPTSARELAAAMGASRQALHYHLRKMTRDGSVRVERGTEGLVVSSTAA